MEEIKFNKENVEIYEQISEMLEDKATLILENIFKENEITYRGYVDSVELSDGMIHIITYYTTCTCCSGDYEHYYFPKSYLYDSEEDYLSDFKEKTRLDYIEEKQKEKEERRLLKVKNDEMRKQREEREKELYEELKKKFAK